jgi:hypothetical protein
LPLPVTHLPRSPSLHFPLPLPFPPPNYHCNSPKITSSLPPYPPLPLQSPHLPRSPSSPERTLFCYISLFTHRSRSPSPSPNGGAHTHRHH